MKSKLSRYSLATLIGLGLGATAFANAAQQTDTPPRKKTAAQRIKAARRRHHRRDRRPAEPAGAGVSTITAEEIKNARRRATSAN